MPSSIPPVRHISISIERSCQEVYDFASGPSNLPEWATGLGSSIEKVDGAWIAESSMGRVRVEFVEANRFGVLDHTVTLPTGETFYNPMRVVPNGDGSEVVFTLIRATGVDDAEFEADVAAVARDLAALKALLER